MKYTEAVALIEETFEMQGTGVQMRTKDAACILDALIEAGMLPPQIDNTHALPSGGYLGLDAALTKGLREWEPE
jgi:hypothetical protein